VRNPQDRIDAFKPFGFDTLVIWERELKDIENVKNKIQEFHAQ
jgi:G:T-mismatch repair DNA endonuclease (very short patch repair protein)